MTLPAPATVLEAECIGVKETLSWLTEFQGSTIVVETDSLLTTTTVNNNKQNLLEFGHIVEHARCSFRVSIKSVLNT